MRGIAETQNENGGKTCVFDDEAPLATLLPSSSLPLLSSYTRRYYRRVKTHKRARTMDDRRFPALERVWLFIQERWLAHQQPAVWGKWAVKDRRSVKITVILHDAFTKTIRWIWCDRGMTELIERIWSLLETVCWEERCLKKKGDLLGGLLMTCSLANLNPFIWVE